MPKTKLTLSRFQTAPRRHVDQVTRYGAPSTAGERRQAEIDVADRVHHHEYVIVGVPGIGRRGQPVTKVAVGSEWHAEEDRAFVRVSPVATMVPERKRGRLAKDWNRQAERTAGRRDFWDATLERTTGDRTDPMVSRPEIRRSLAQRDFDGAKDNGRSAGAAKDMRANVKRNWNRYQASHLGATRS